ncbi:MAG TPA: hypothetical protein VNT51_13010 [Miltoncostaeaceae bacterium]|nr:hypothetical protein [Miltoncostaeaceae bacterium]
MATYDRPVRGADVAGAAAAFPGRPVDPDRVRAALAPDRPVAGLAALRRLAGPERLGVSAGVWETVFAPLFGEFE